MKSKLLFTATILATAALAPLQAATNKASTNPAPATTPAASPSPAKMRAIPFRSTIASADKEKKTITLTSKKGEGRTIMISDETKLMKADGETAATWDELVAGAAVTGSYMKSEDGSMKAKTVKVGAKTEAEASPSPAMSPKEKKSKKS